VTATQEANNDRVIDNLVNHDKPSLIPQYNEELVKVDGVARYKVSPDDWLHKSIIDQLTPTQEPHAFISIAKLGRFL
jgi:hypothetical protein